MKINNRASIFLYILLLVSIALVLGMVVFNNSITLTNNLNIGKNSEEVFNNLSDKAEVTIDTVKKYNSNGEGFSDGISCPTNVTMSGTTLSGSHISTSMVDNYGTVYCSGNYNGEEFRIYFTEDKSTFKSAYYKGDLVDLKYDTASSTTTKGTANIIDSTTLGGTTDYNSNYPKSNVRDGNINTRYLSQRGMYYSHLDLTFGSSRNIYEIDLYKRRRTYRKYTDYLYVSFYDDSNNLIDEIDISGVRRKTDINIYLGNIGKTIKTKKIIIEGYWRRYLTIEELYIHEWENIASSPKWVGVRDFDDSDSTLISFEDDGVLGSDLIDDDLNSDDYTVGSTRKADGTIVYYADGYQDDDVIPRKIIFGNVPAKTDLYNIFWNNYKTIDYIDNNINNDDNLNIKMGLVSSGALYLDLYTLGDYNYDLKILEFNRNDYKNKYTLLPIATSIGNNLNDFVGYIQKSSSGVLSLSKYKTGNEYEFDFATKDYGIYISNHDEDNLSYRISGEVITSNISKTGSGIYINPVDDSGTGTISVMSNHMIIGGEKNFIGENFIVTEAK